MLTTSRLPSQDVILTASRNKKQLVEMIVQDLINHKDTLDGRIIVTGGSSVPVEICDGKVTYNDEMAVTHEEADTIIIYQIIQAGANKVQVVADDTDIFVLLCHFVHINVIRGQVWMVSPQKNRAVIDINATVLLHKDVMNNLLAAHGLTGCDTVATYFGIGKVKVLKVLKNNVHSLDLLGNTCSSLIDATKQATTFVLACYGQSRCSTMTEARQKVWSRKVFRTIGGAPKLETLPPTTEAFNENVARAHLQVAIWRHAGETDPPEMNPVMYGWTTIHGALKPTPLPGNVPEAPDELLKMIKCACESELPCQSKRCGCKTANIACTNFCACQGKHGSCFNEKTKERLQFSSDDESDENEDDNI